MAAVVGINAKIEYSTDDVVYNELDSERNEFTINISVDVAERRPFVATLADAWVKKGRTWMNWNGSISGYFDDADDTIFNTMKAGAVIYLKFFDDRAVTTKYWQGQVLLTSVEHGVTTEDFATLNVDFEGTDTLSRVVP
jgi:hypothetical protein